MTGANLRLGMVLPGLLLPAALAAQQPPTVSLGEAIELALRVQPAVVQARGAVTNARAGSREVTGSWLPQLNANSSWSRSQVSATYNQEGIPFTPPANNYRAGWSASINIFDGFQRLA